MSYTAIGNKIAELIDEIVEVKVVYNYAETNPTQFPAVCVRMKGHNNSFGDTEKNRRVYSFTADLLYKTENAADAERILRTVADLIITKIESNPALGGTCMFSTPTKGEVIQLAEPIRMQMVSIQIDATAYVARNV